VVEGGVVVVARRGGGVDVLLGDAATRRGLNAAGERGGRRRSGVARVPREEGPHGSMAGCGGREGERETSAGGKGI
jgi:hypothetical protein